MNSLMNTLISSLISSLWSIVQFTLMILLSYVLDGLIFLFGGFGQAICNYATNWRAAVMNVIGLAATIASVYYFLAAPLHIIFIILLVTTSMLSIAVIRESTVNETVRPLKEPVAVAIFLVLFLFFDRCLGAQ